jgi:head-tail adaptor
MIRAGKLDREVIIQRASTAIDGAGTPQQTWVEVVTLRAELMDDVTDEQKRDQGESTERALTFQTRFYPGVTVADCLVFECEKYNLVQVKPIGRRRGLELRAVRVGP